MPRWAEAAEKTGCALGGRNAGGDRSAGVQQKRRPQNGNSSVKSLDEGPAAVYYQDLAGYEVGFG
jgi:hypothetical protein